MMAALRTHVQAFFQGFTPCDLATLLALAPEPFGFDGTIAIVGRFWRNRRFLPRPPAHRLLSTSQISTCLHGGSAGVRVSSKRGKGPVQLLGEHRPSKLMGEGHRGERQKH